MTMWLSSGSIHRLVLAIMSSTSSIVVHRPDIVLCRALAHLMELMVIVMVMVMVMVVGVVRVVWMGRWGGGGSMVHPGSGRSVNPTSIKGCKIVPNPSPHTLLANKDLGSFLRSCFMFDCWSKLDRFRCNSKFVWQTFAKVH